MHLLTGATGYIGGRLLRRLQRRWVGSQMFVPQPGGAWLARSPRHGVGAGGSAAAGVSGCGVFRGGHRLLFGPLHEQREEFEAEERQAASQFRGGCAQSGRAADHLPGRAGARRWAFCSYAQPGRDRKHSAFERRSRNRTSGLHRDRVRQRIFRNDPGSGGKAPVMITPRWVNTAAQPIGIEDVIEYLLAAARFARRRGQSHIRNRRCERNFLRRDHERVCPAAESPALDRARSVPQLVVVEPLADADHPGLCSHRPLPHRKRPQSERRAELRRLSAAFDIQPMGISARHRASACERGSQNSRRPAGAMRGRRPDGFVFSAHQAGAALLMNEQSVRVPARPHAGFRPDSPDWRPDRLVLRQLHCGGFAG